MIQNKKKIISLVFLFILVLFGSLMYLKQDKLTVTHIHDNIFHNQTTVTELVELYGEPEFIESNPDKVKIASDNCDDTEGGISEHLYEYTDYFDTLKSRKREYSRKRYYYDSYYEYRGDNLGLEYVRFYIRDGYVRNHFYGEIKNLHIARQDKYLRQIIEE